MTERKARAKAAWVGGLFVGAELLANPGIGLLEEFGAVGAALGVVADLGVLVGAEAAVAGVADGVGDGGDDRSCCTGRRY